MGDDEEKWGTPKMYLGDGTEMILTKEPILALSKEEVEDFNSETELASHYIGIPKEGLQYDFSVKLSHASYKRMVYRFAIEDAHHLAEVLSNWIRDRMVSSRLPRKKKKWCKKVIALRIANSFGIEAKHLLKYIKPKKNG